MTIDGTAIVIGGKHRASVALKLCQPLSLDAEPYLPRVRTRIEIEAGPFRACYVHDLDINAFLRFRNEFEKLHKNLVGEAEYLPVDGALCLRVKGDGLGHMRLAGEASDEDASNRLEFTSDLDQTDIPSVLKAFDEWMLHLSDAGLPKVSSK